MEWAKLHSQARFNLVKSDVAAYPLAKLPVRLDDLEINGPNPYGYAPLQERLARRSGVAEECVVAAAGTSMANHLALAALLEPGDEVLIEHPTYEPILAAARYLGAVVRRFPRRFEDGFAVDPAAVARAMTPATRAVVVTNLHNPSGVRVPDEVLRQVAEVAARHGAHLLVDEVYLEACFDTPVRSAFHLAPNVVATSSLTKAYGLSGLRCGWVLAAPPLARRMWRINDLHGATAAHPAERLAVAALDHLDAIAADSRALLARNRALLDAFLAARRDLAWVPPAAGTLVFPRLLSGGSLAAAPESTGGSLAAATAESTGRVDALCDLLRERYETTVAPGRFFEMPEHFRIGFGGETAMVAEGLARLGRALDELA
jgi:hypothetical protein